MRRLPIYFLVDVSESMVGDPIDQIQNGMRTIIQELRVDPYALETAFVSIIAFAGKAMTLTSLTELYKFYPPIFPIGSGTALGDALNFLMDEMDKSIQLTTLEVKGDWKPIVFLFTDGVPTDEYSAAFTRWNNKYRSTCNLIAVSIGENVNIQVLGQITENVLRLNDTDKESFQKFFKWITASIKATSVSVSDYSNDDLKLAPTDGITLEKVDPNKTCIVDENFIVLHGKCQNTSQSYLVKYAKNPHKLNLDNQFENKEIFKLIGAYPIDGESYNWFSGNRTMTLNVNTNKMRGVPTCPCCGNQLGVVVCECGNVFCVGSDMVSKCPWCGLEGSLGEANSGGIDVNRGQG